MALLESWSAALRDLPRSWRDADVRLQLEQESDAPRALQLLGPVAPHRAGREIRFQATSRGSLGPDAVGRLLTRLDAERLHATLTIDGARMLDEAPAPPADSLLADSWDAALEALPSDWSDLVCEVALATSDDLDPAALHLAPVNPGRFGSAPAFRFRVASRDSYGASIGMTRRCLARLDEAGIPGLLTISRSLSQTRPVATQGPSWYVDGKVV